jgi:uncharacterized surface protein with fasciclin (FAS1) repeats
MKIISKTIKLLSLCLLVTLVSCGDDDDNNSGPNGCSADAGSLVATESVVTLTDGSATISANAVDAPVVPNNYEVTYVLTSGDELTIEQAGATPSFTVTNTDDYTIHTLIAETSDTNDPNYLDLSVIVFGTTTGGDVLGIVVSQELCADLDVVGAPVTVTASIVDIADNAGLTILSDALELTDLDTVIDGFITNGDEFTIFAPLDTAFVALLDSNPDWNSLEDIPEATLEAVLLYHVLGTQNGIEFFNEEGEGYLTTASPNGAEGNPLSLYFNQIGDQLELNGGNTAPKGANTEVALAEEIDNGIIYILDKVLLLPTIADFATTNGELSNLVGALVRADEGSNPLNWIETVSNENVKLTVFAPFNNAFAELLSDLSVTGLDEVAPETVNGLLTLHVVNEANIRSTDLPTEDTAVGTIGGDITVNGTVITDGNDNTINIVVPLVDIQAVNGVVHVVDYVIRAAVE